MNESKTWIYWSLTKEYLGQPSLELIYHMQMWGKDLKWGNKPETAFKHQLTAFMTGAATF